MPECDHLELSRQFTEAVTKRMQSIFVGKDEVIDLLGISLVAAENLFILGPPGTAKSALVQCLAKQINGKVFDYLLTRFTEPNEVFGPFDIRRLREGDLVTNTEGMLPEADFVFLDELLNANSAILNSLLMVLNERVYRRGKETTQLPTLMVVGASNRLPDDEALNALFDRFLLRVSCENVDTSQLHDVLCAGWSYQQEGESDGSSISVDTIRSLQALVPQVDFGELRPRYVQLIVRLRNAGIEISDRRAVKLQRVLAASAVLMGRMSVNPTDFWVLKYIWDSMQQREVLDEIVSKFIDEASESEKRQSHPAAIENRLPDSEQIAKGLEAIEIKAAAELSVVESAFLREQVGVMRQRVQWLKDDVQRDFLNQRVEALMANLANI